MHCHVIFCHHTGVQLETLETIEHVTQKSLLKSAGDELYALHPAYVI